VNARIVKKQSMAAKASGKRNRAIIGNYSWLLSLGVISYGYLYI
jgi:hypothetical protein